MILRFRCKDCGQKYQVPDDYAAGEFKCVECGGEMEIPESSTLHDRPAVDLGVEDQRPLVDIEIKVKNKAPNNKLGSERDFIDKKLSQAETVAEDTPSIDEELINGYLSPRNNANIGALKPISQSSTSAKVSPLGTSRRELSHNSRATVESKPSTKTPERPTTLPQTATVAPSIKPLAVKPPAIKPLTVKPPAIKPPPVKPSIPAHYTAQNIAPGDGFCETHPQLRATSACNACRKPICLECRQRWGYYCSEACRDSSLSSIDRKIKADHQQENAKLNWVVRIIKIIILVTTCVILGFVGMWIWRIFLDPGGKVAWVWNKPDSSIQLLKTTPKHLITLTNKDIITLDSQTGKVISSFNNKVFASMRLDKIMDDRLILSGKKTLALVDLSAKEKWQISFKDPIANTTIGSEVALVTTRHWVASKKTYRTRAGRFQCPPTAVTHLSAVELEHGKMLWQILKQKNDFSIVAIGDKNYISLGTIIVHKKSKMVLKVNDLRTRKDLGQIKLSAYPTMGPLLYNGNIIFRIKDNLYAIDMTGKTIWSAQVEGYCSDYNFKANDDLAFFATDSGLTVFDMKQGKVLWSKSLDAKQIAYVSGKLLMKVYEVDEAYSKRHQNDKAPKLPAAYEQLKKGDPVITAILGGNHEKRIRYNRFIVCLDARTGKKLWKSAKIRGQLLVGAGRVVIFRDAIIAAQLSAISSKRLGKSIVEQLSLETGEQLFKRQDDIGVTAPQIIGNKLVGDLYDRNYDNTKSIGLAGFNLK